MFVFVFFVSVIFGGVFSFLHIFFWSLILVSGMKWVREMRGLILVSG